MIHPSDYHIKVQLDLMDWQTLNTLKLQLLTSTCKISISLTVSIQRKKTSFIELNRIFLHLMYTLGKVTMSHIDSITMISYPLQLVIETIQTHLRIWCQPWEELMELIQWNSFALYLDSVLPLIKTQHISLPGIIEIMENLRLCIIQVDMMLGKELYLVIKLYMTWELHMEMINKLLKNQDLVRIKQNSLIFRLLL